MNIKMRAFFTIDQFLFCPGRSYIKKMSPFFYHWPVFIHAQDNRAASGESRPDPIATNPQHKCSRLNGQGKYLTERGDDQNFNGHQGSKRIKISFLGAMIACAISWMNIIVGGSDLVQRTLRKWEVFLSWVNIDKKYKYTKIQIYKNTNIQIQNFRELWESGRWPSPGSTSTLSTSSSVVTQ